MRLLRKIFGSDDKGTAKPDRAMVSLVVLYDTYLELSLESLRQALDQEFPGEFLPPREFGNFVVDGAVPGSTFMILSAIPEASGMFMLNNVPGPYTEFSYFAEYISDDVLRERATAQNCWLSIDLINLTTSIEDAYRFIGKVLARLAPDDAAFLVHPETYCSIVFDNDVRARLAGGSCLFPMR